MADFKADEFLDITAAVCPLTFVKVKAALEEMEEGRILSVRLNAGEAAQNVPRSIKDEGHELLKLSEDEDGAYNLLVRKTGE